MAKSTSPKVFRREILGRRAGTPARLKAPFVVGKTCSIEKSVILNCAFECEVEKRVSVLKHPLKRVIRFNTSNIDMSIRITMYERRARAHNFVDYRSEMRDSLAALRADDHHFRGLDQRRGGFSHFQAHFPHRVGRNNRRDVLPANR